MRILLLCHSFNSLTQRVFVELRRTGHEVSVEFDVNDSVTEEAVALFRPELVIAPFLRRAIPESVWRAHRCIVLHPGIEGDRGPSALDWAIMNGEHEWGVTALQATGEMDAGDIWASVDFSMREATKASLYRNEVTEAAVAALELTVSRLRERGFRPRPLDYARPGVRGRLRPVMRQDERRIDWHGDDTATVLRRIRAADGAPGVLDAVRGVACYLYGAHAEGGIRGGRPGDVIARRDGAILRATRDGALWITHLKRADDPEAFKLPASMVLQDKLADVPELPLPPHASVEHRTWRPIRYEEKGAVGYLHFDFYNGAMGTQHCDALREAYALARSRPTRVIVLAGGEDFWSNGIHLNLIEASPHPAEESWRNINAMNDLVREIATTDRQLTIAALAGNAGAGGVFLGLAADRVWARDGIVLNPHYKSMGNLYGSEYWTYLLPRRVAPEQARAVVENRLPLGVDEAGTLGLIDAHFGVTRKAFHDEVDHRAAELASDASFAARVEAKNRRRAADEAAKPLERYREEELERMRLNFFGFDSSYHVARYNFVHKVPRSRTPLYLARHRERVANRAAGDHGESSAVAVAGSGFSTRESSTASSDEADRRVRGDSAP
ncbi:MAG TPA: hydrogenase maturation protein [Casimicrobiaceae bacterium]|nr:hydrogenase maturation protein [Casimicrobiaceae bacterium]